jgi:hypothetical protein
VLADGEREVLGAWPGPTAGVTAWQQVCDDLRVRGVEKMRFISTIESTDVRATYPGAIALPSLGEQEIAPPRPPPRHSWPCCKPVRCRRGALRLGGSWRSEQLPWRHSERQRQTLNVRKRNVPSRAFHCRHVRPIKFALHSKILLGPRLLYSEQSNVVRQNRSRIAGRRKFNGRLGSGRHPASVVVW